VKLPVAPTPRLAIVQVMVPVPPTDGVVQLQPTGEESETNVVFAGTDSVKLTVVVVEGPLLVKLCTYVTLALGATVDGEAEFVTAMSAEAGKATRMLTVALLLVSVVSFVPELTLSVSPMVVPAGVALPTTTASVKLDETEMSFTARIQEMLPVPPTAGVVQVHGAVDEREENVVLVGIASLNTTLTADCGPLLPTVWV
jgi:hypothetical protein